MEAKSKLNLEHGKTSTPFPSRAKKNFQTEDEISSIVAVEKKKKLIVSIVEAIEAIGQPRKGASYQAIKKWIINLKGGETNSLNRMLKLAVTKGLASGELVRPKHCLTAVGITGSFSLPKKGSKKPPTKTDKPSETKTSPLKEKKTQEKSKGKKVAQVTGKKVPAKPVINKVGGKKAPAKNAVTKVTGKKTPANNAVTKVTGKKAPAKNANTKVTGKIAPAKNAVTKVTGKKAPAKSKITGAKPPAITKLTGKKASAKSSVAKVAGKGPAKSETVPSVFNFSNIESEEDEKISMDVVEKRGIKTASKQLSKQISNKKPAAKMDSLETEAKQTSHRKEDESLKKNNKDTVFNDKTFEGKENAKEQPKKKDASQLGQSKMTKKSTRTTADKKTSKAPEMKTLYASNPRRKDLSDTELDTTMHRPNPIPLKSYSSDTELEISKRNDQNSKKSTKTRERKMPGKKIRDITK